MNTEAGDGAETMDCVHPRMVGCGHMPHICNVQIDVMEELLQCLLIDDDQDDQEIFLMTLAKINKNIKCYTVNNGVEALSMLEEKKEWIPDYIFLDVNMPKMNGIDCLKGLYGFQHLKNTKIFMYSTTSENSVIEKSKELGAHDFIIKQASPSALKVILSRIFE